MDISKISGKQHDIRDCGAACLSSIGGYHGLQLSIAKIRQYCHTDTRGTNILGLTEGLAKMGFNAKGIRGNEEALSQIPLPAIAHIVIKDQLQYFLVIYRVDKQHITTMDPGVGKMETYY